MRDISDLWLVKSHSQPARRRRLFHSVTTKQRTHLHVTHQHCPRSALPVCFYLLSLMCHRALLLQAGWHLDSSSPWRPRCLINVLCHLLLLLERAATPESVVLIYFLLYLVLRDKMWVCSDTSDGSHCETQLNQIGSFCSIWTLYTAMCTARHMYIYTVTMS